MSQGARTRLSLVRTGFQQLTEREKVIRDLVKAAARHFPSSSDTADQKRIESQRARWVEAKLALGNTQPAVRVGDGRQTNMTFPRSRREAGITTDENYIPRLFRRFFRTKP